MNFNIYNDSVFRKIISRFSLVTAFAFKTFVLAPSVTFLFFFFFWPILLVELGISSLSILNQSITTRIQTHIVSVWMNR